jgi:hypothetical protein
MDMTVSDDYTAGRGGVATISVRNVAGGIARRVTAGLRTKAGWDHLSSTTIGVIAPRDEWAAMEIEAPIERLVPGWEGMTPAQRSLGDPVEQCLFWVQYHNRFGEAFQLRQVGRHGFPEVIRV